jgi:hypothetical protein
MRRSLEGEQHLALAIVMGRVAVRFAVIRKRVGRFDRGGEGAVPTGAASSLEDHTIELESPNLVAVELGHTDTNQTTCLHVPDVGLVVAGDAAYNDVHLYLAESDPQGRREWIAALDTIGSLHLQTVIAGHQRAGRHDGPEIIEETPAVHPRLRPRRRDNEYGARPLRPGPCALSRPQPGRGRDLGAGAETLDIKEDLA